MVPHVMELLDGSIGTSSRSSSLASLRSRDRGKDVVGSERLACDLIEPHENDTATPTAYATASSGPATIDSTPEPDFPMMNDESQSTLLPSLAVSKSEFDLLEDSPQTADLGRLDPPQISLSSSPASYSGSISDSTHISSTPLETPISEESNDRSPLVPSQSLPPYVTNLVSPNALSPTPSADNRKTSNSHNAHLLGSWDGQLPPPLSNATASHRKPPRFKSKSKPTHSGSVSPIPTSISYSTTYSKPHCPPDSPPSASSSSQLLPPEPALPSLTFPTLNPQSPSPTPSPGPSSDGHSGLNGSAQGRHTPRVGTRQVPTPSSTPDLQQSVSTQTQIASLRGALEAARLREEKYRQDAENYVKEIEMLKWKWSEDTMAWRQKEAEVISSGQFHRSTS